MVNFKELAHQKELNPIVEPRNLFQTLRLNKTFEYLRDVQGDVLDEWYEHRNRRDIVIKMNTGSGKTLVGLLLLRSRLNEGKGPALYLCPNNHLVSQVRNEADKLGNQACRFRRKQSLFRRNFTESTGVLITNVQKAFQRPFRFSSRGPVRSYRRRNDPH